MPTGKPKWASRTTICPHREGGGLWKIVNIKDTSHQPSASALCMGKGRAIIALQRLLSWFFVRLWKVAKKHVLGSFSKQEHVCICNCSIFLSSPFYKCNWMFKAKYWDGRLLRWRWCQWHWQVRGGHRMNGWKGDVTSDGSFRAQQKPPQRNLKPQLT